ncbi:hypothetical protein HPB47_001072 [Ixodes persulcatus]|uniref:Uncharacterized protein n=1 Tax=Ixodes persulcatus TaxID=34615 RepID=A0AC60PQD0_IXOPE|nr:hypothetical protein HPB47_001072 [Ixodes persulcatus]
MVSRLSADVVSPIKYPTKGLLRGPTGNTFGWPSQVTEFMWESLRATLPKKKNACAPAPSPVLFLGEASAPKSVTDVLQGGPKYSLPPNPNPIEKLCIAKALADRVTPEERERFISEAVDVLRCKSGGQKKAPRTAPVVSYFQENKLKLLTADKEGGFVVIPEGLFGEKSRAAIQKNFRQVEKHTPLWRLVNARFSGLASRDTMDRKRQALKAYAAHVSKLCPKDWTANELHAELCNSTSPLTSKKVDLNRPCTGSETQFCHIYDELSLWNEVLCHCHMQIKEVAPKELAISAFHGRRLEPGTAAKARYALVLVHWLLKEHHCLRALRIQGSVIFKNSELLCDALRLACTGGAVQSGVGEGRPGESGRHHVVSAGGHSCYRRQ